MSLCMLVASLFSATVFGGNPKDKEISLRRTELVFTENKGQLPTTNQGNSVLYYLEGSSVNLFLKKNGFSYMWYAPDKSSIQRKHGRSKKNAYRMDLEFVNASRNVKVHAEEETGDFNNYYLKKNTDGILGVKNFRKVVYENLYPKIDMICYLADGSDKGQKVPVKVDFVVKPGGDPKQIKLNYKGHQRIKLNADGTLSTTCALGELKEGKPLVYQTTNESDKKKITSSYAIDRNNQVSFKIGNYDKSRDLVIDPSIQWGTYYGGTSYEFNGYVATDASGNAYLAGTTYSAGLGTSGSSLAGTYSEIIVKFDPTGQTRYWATYYGTDNAASDICLEKTGNYVYVSGTEITEPTPNMYYPDATLLKLNASTGQMTSVLVYGGDGYEYGSGVAVDDDNNVYLAGTTTGARDFVGKYSSSFSSYWERYIGHSTVVGPRVATDGDENVFLVGSLDSDDGNNATGIATSGTHQTSASGDMEAYLVKYNSSGTIVWGTFFGGSLDETGSDVDVDASGNIFITGLTHSTTNVSYVTSGTTSHQATYGGGDADAYLAKFSNNNGTVIWSTYYGGSGTGGGDYKEAGLSVSTFSNGKVIMTGNTHSSSGIATSVGGEDQTFGGGNIDGFVVKFDANGAREWGSYIGGSSDDYALGSAVNSNDFYVSGNTNSSSATSMIVNAYQNAHAGSGDLFLIRYTEAPPTITTVSMSPDYSCGVPTAINFTTTGTFNSGNTFTAQLSDATGSFASPINLTPSSGSSPINTTLPYLTAGGTFKIRVVSSNPVVIGTSITITVTGSTVVGATQNNPIVLGTLGCTTLRDTVDNNPINCYGDDYNSTKNALHVYGQPSDDIYYQFTLDRIENVMISLCSSPLTNTYVHLLDASGVRISSNDDAGPFCNNQRSSLVQTLSAGTYFVVVEGKGTNSGSIVLELSKREGLKFVDDGDVLTAASNNSLLDLGTGAFTFVGNIASTKTSGYSIIMSKRSSSSDGYLLGINTDGRLWVQLAGTDYIAPTSTPSLYDSKCHYVAVIRDASNSLKFYIDGSLIHTVSISSTNITNTGTLRLGHDNTWGSSGDVKGWLRDVQIWSTALSQTTIQNNLNKSINSQTGLVACWKLTEGTGQVIPDASGHVIPLYVGLTASTESQDPVFACLSSCDAVPTSFIPEQVAKTTGIDAAGSEIQLNVYPNPFSQTTTIVVRGNGEKAMLEISDVKGKIVYKNDNYITNQSIILGEDFLPGFYILRTTTADVNKSLKLIKTE